MSKPEITPAQRRMLEDLTASFADLVRDVQDKLKAAQAAQQKVAAHASMLQAYGWPIPEVEGLSIQAMSPAEQASLMQAMQHTDKPSLAVLQPPTVTQPQVFKPSVREAVREILKSGGEYSVHELRDQIHKKYGFLFGVSSVYRILMEEYTSSEGKWSAKKK